MTAFFICIILIGILISVIAMVWMIIEKKNMRDYRLDLDERRHDLEHVIEDAEQLLDELNNFSEYIANNLEEKQQSIEAAVRRLNEKLELFNRFQDLNCELQDEGTEFFVPAQNPDNPEIEIPISEIFNTQRIKKGKVIPLDIRRHEVIKLYKSGMDSTEIAKMLNMGKGEIELISRMCK